MATFITDIIKEEYRQWETGDQIVFDTQTGTGKTTFVFDVLLPYAAEQGESILYLVNRVALRRQLEKRLLEKPEELQRHMTIISYQEFVLRRKHGRYGESTDFGWTIDRAKYWVLDEAHYFLSDNTFNSGVVRCVAEIAGQYRRHVTIFITATTSNLFLTNFPGFEESEGKSQFPCIPYVDRAHERQRWSFNRFSSCNELLIHKEVDEGLDGLVGIGSTRYTMERLEMISRSQRKEYFSQTFQRYMDKFEELTQSITIYSLPRDYRKINPVYFLEFGEIVNEILRTHHKEKWIIFVESKSQGRDLEKALLEKDIPSVFIESNSKRRRKDSVERQAYDSIVERKSYDQSVLISTSVLDNGIDIDDEKVKHVVIENFERTTFIQMLGRRRIPFNGDGFKLYIKAHSYGSLKQRFSRNILSIVHFLYRFNLEKWGTFSQSRDPQIELEQYLDNGKFKSPFGNYLMLEKHMIGGYRSEIATKENAKILLDLYRITPLHKDKLAFQYYYYLALFEKTENQNPQIQNSDLFVSLREQLSWIDKEYDESCWINHKKQMKLKASLERQLSFYSSRREAASFCGVRELNIEQQTHFKDTVLNYAKELRPRHPISKTKGSLQKINEALEDWGYPYRVISKSRELKGVKRNYWHIVHITETENSDKQPLE